MATTSVEQQQSPRTIFQHNLPIETMFRYGPISSADRYVAEQLANDAAEKELVSCDDEIDRHWDTSASLDRKRPGIATKLFQYHSLFEPLHRLPTEILGIIFTMVSDLPPLLLQQSGEGTPALTVSRTCKRWRDIALSMPSIWSSIFIAFEQRDDDDDHQEYHQLLALVQLFLNRSQKRPLTINLNFGHFVDLEDEEQTIVPILRTLVQHSERWRSVTLHDTLPTVLAHEVFSPLSGRLPMLTSLTVFRLRVAPVEVLPDLRGLFSDCPSLTAFHCDPTCLDQIHCPLPRGPIKSLEIDNSSSENAIIIASLYPNIEALTMRWCGDGMTHTGHPLLSPSVTRLSVYAAGVEDSVEDCDTSSPFKHFTLPKLSSLEMSCTTGSDDEERLEEIRWNEWDEQPIVDFFNRSGCTVTSLSLRYVPITDEQLIHLLRLMPVLSSLCLEETSIDRISTTNRTITRRFLQKLTIDIQDSSPPFLPKLTDIRLILREEGLADEVLPKALVSRWTPDNSGCRDGVARIRSIDIAFIAGNGETVEDLESKLRCLRVADVWVTVGRT